MHTRSIILGYFIHQEHEVQVTMNVFKPNLSQTLTSLIGFESIGLKTAYEENPQRSPGDSLALVGYTDKTACSRFFEQFVLK